MSEEDILRENPSQTAGPYVHIGCMPNYAGIQGVYEKDLGAYAVGEGMYELQIRVFDGCREMVTDAMIEIWIASSGFWARSAFDETGQGYLFSCPKPVHDKEKQFAPHISVWLVARGINLGLNTRIYFPDEDNSTDAVLNNLEDDRRGTLIAEKSGNGYRFDIHLQGENETVFFDL